MVVVAIAGGTGAVGRTIVKALVDSGNHTVFVLSRMTTGDHSTVQRLAVDYNDVQKIAAVLRHQEVEVVISTMVFLDASVATAQLNLIRGAAQSTTVTKFIPSEFHMDFYAPVERIELSFKKYQLEAVDELKRHPQLTWTLIRNGLFLDYLGMPYHAKPTNMMPWSIFVDLDHETCVLPGDGTNIITFTHSNDLATFVERLVGLPAAEWPRESLIEPNRLQLNEIAGIIKEVTGQTFKVIYDSADTIYGGHITQLPSNKELFADPSWGELYQSVEKEAMFTVLSNGYDLGGKNLAEIYPDVQTTNLRDFLRQSWALRNDPPRQ